MPRYSLPVVGLYGKRSSPGCHGFCHGAVPCSNCSMIRAATSSAYSFFIVSYPLPHGLAVHDDGGSFRVSGQVRVRGPRLGFGHGRFFECAVGFRFGRRVLDLHAGRAAVFGRLAHDGIDTRGQGGFRFCDLLGAARFFFGAHGFFLSRLTYKHGSRGRVRIERGNAHGDLLADAVAGQVAVQKPLLKSPVL